MLTGLTEEHVIPTYENPVENDAYKKKEKHVLETRVTVDPSLQANPSYEPLTLRGDRTELKDSPKLNSKQKLETGVDPVLQSNPSYEPL